MTATWVAAGAVLALAYVFRALVVPLLLAAAVAYLLNPVVAWAEAFAVRRDVAVAALYLAVVLLLVAGGVVLGPSLGTEAAALVDGLPGLADRVNAGLDLTSRDLAEAVPALRRWLPTDQARRLWTDRLLGGGDGRLGDTLENAGYLFLLAILIPFFAFFLLRDTPRVLARLMNRLPPAYVETSVAIWYEIEGVIGRYLRGVALDGAVVGILAGLALWALGVPYPLLLGIFTGLANAIPFLGPLLSAAAAGLVAITSGHGLGVVLGVALVFLALKALDDAVIQPLTIGRSVHLHPMLLLGSVVAGSQALGILGMIVAVPAVTVVQETARLLLEPRRRETAREVLALQSGPVATYLC